MLFDYSYYVIQAPGKTAQLRMHIIYWRGEINCFRRLQALLCWRKLLQDVDLQHASNSVINDGIFFGDRRWCTKGTVGDNLACSDAGEVGLWRGIWDSYQCHSIWHAGEFQSSHGRPARGNHHHSVSKPRQVAVYKTRWTVERWRFATGTVGLILWIYISTEYTICQMIYVNNRIQTCKNEGGLKMPIRYDEHIYLKHFNLYSHHTMWWFSNDISEGATRKHLQR